MISFSTQILPLTDGRAIAQGGVVLSVHVAGIQPESQPFHTLRRSTRVIPGLHGVGGTPTRAIPIEGLSLPGKAHNRIAQAFRGGERERQRIIRLGKRSVAVTRGQAHQ